LGITQNVSRETIQVVLIPGRKAPTAVFRRDHGGRREKEKMEDGRWKRLQVTGYKMPQIGNREIVNSTETAQKQQPASQLLRGKVPVLNLKPVIQEV